jgi:CBS domain-containing protein
LNPPSKNRKTLERERAKKLASVQVVQPVINYIADAVACTTLTAEVQERGYERREHFERERNRNHDRCTRSHRKEGGRHGLVTVAPDDDLNRVMKLMTRHRVRHMPVLRDGKLSGIIPFYIRV